MNEELKLGLKTLFEISNPFLLLIISRQKLRIAKRKFLSNS